MRNYEANWFLIGLHLRRQTDGKSAVPQFPAIMGDHVLALANHRFSRSGFYPYGAADV